MSATVLTFPARSKTSKKPRIVKPTPDSAVLVRIIFTRRATGLGYLLQQAAKRSFDFSAALLGILAICPLLAGIALAVKLTSPGPVIYKSLRIGRDYKPFYMYKFRTMQINADALRDKLRKEQKLEGNLFKMKDDPRVTPIGKFLRAFSLDELPQLFNVLEGTMSLVGPRPLPPDESELFADPYTMRYKVTPGITGIWQVSGRSQLDFKRLCELELGYVTRWTLVEDFRILLKTLPAVLQKSGAY